MDLRCPPVACILEDDRLPIRPQDAGELRIFIVRVGRADRERVAQRRWDIVAREIEGLQVNRWARLPGGVTRVRLPLASQA